ncbi:DMT family transporter [Deinococcus cellulosilyticus]|uniref:Membrane protein n=1 Tax=Deinococcus cellulosilyticus (strain DSM 18568 / NBRC 106333 / KACC 11606 / 5516J-15) TaxID=1223518 RepID=A0A511N5T5_DEIC1|nr:DMT family transporter [Deinococcus cellulosilyticus]GEM47761.1 membrane protein [Deinococcus cellulosilyticus NBRC 106333 = KACC 11606]
MQAYLWLILLSALWGFSFIFMRVAVPSFGPILLIELRTLIAALTLFPILALLKRNIKAGLPLKPLWITGIFNSALPFVMISVATKYVPASVAAVLNATTPLFSLLVAVLLYRQQMNSKNVLGVLLGLTGVAALFGLGALTITPQVLLACLCSLIAAASYGFAGNYARHALKQAAPLVTSTYSQFFAALALLPLVPFVLPDQTPPVNASVSVLALGVVCTGLAYLIYFKLIREAGAVFTSTVTFLAPAFSVLWGGLLLGEHLTLGLAVGFVLIVLSVRLINAR